MSGSRGPGRDRQFPRAQPPLSATPRDEPDLAPADRFGALAELLLEELAADLELRELHLFGAVGLTVGGKIFTLLVQDRLVVKLPRSRVDALVASGAGDRFAPASGRPWQEWLSLTPHADEDWLELSREALAFVAPRGHKKPAARQQCQTPPPRQSWQCWQCWQSYPPRGHPAYRVERGPRRWRATNPPGHFSA